MSAMCVIRAVFFVIIGCAVLLVNAAPPRGKNNSARAMAMFNACKDQAKVTQTDLEVLERKEVPTTKTGKCFMACMMEKGRIMKNGKYDKTRATNIVKKVFANNQSSLQDALKVIDSCDRQANGQSDKCEVAAKLAQCMKENNLADKRKEVETSTADDHEGDEASV